MKRLVHLILLAGTLATAGCAGLDIGGLADPIVRVAETVTDENTSTAKGVTAGMSSSDAANVLMTRDYYSAVKAVAGAGKGQAAQPILEIESRDGKPITIDAKSVKVYAPPQNGASAQVAIQPPREVESNGIKWFREVRRGLAEVFIPWKIIDDGGQTDRLRVSTDGNLRALELTNMGNAIRGSQDIAGQAIQNYKPAEPIVIETPAPPTAP